MRNLNHGHGTTDFTKFIVRLLLLAALPAALFAAAIAGTLADRPGQVIGANQAKEHRVVFLIDSDDDKVMGHAISYSMNIARAYASVNQRVTIEIVANGAGIKLLRADTSPLQQPLAHLRQTIPGIVLSMCDSSRQIAQQKEGHEIALVPGARLVPFGIGRAVELQEAGWSYIHG